MNPLHSAVFKLRIQAPIQRVWETLTREGEVLPFFFNSVLNTPSLRPGSPLRMRTKDGRYTAVVGDILIVEPPHRFSHTFKFTTLNDPPCRVTYELTDVDGATDLVMLLDDMPAGTKTEKQMTSGAQFITRTLKAILETGKPPLSSRLILGMIGLFAFATPKVCRSEFWPFDKKIS